jgi:trans-aconitate methyltransferase
MTINPWQDPEFAAHHAEGARKNIYEHEVNFPSILSLIPPQAKHILDFGCGPGEYTALMAQNFIAVEGCDNSQAMLDIASKSYAKINFFAWNFHNDLPAGHEPYDVVVSKLTIQFIVDLEAFAAKMGKILRPGGSLVVSVPHPVHSAKQVEDYWQEVGYKQQIGQYGIYDTMIHRSLERYIDIFLDNDFVLTGLAEPKAGPEVIEALGANPDGFLLPKRLNLRFKSTLKI